MKRILAFALSICMLITILASCGGSKGDIGTESNVESCKHEDKILDHICDICGELVGVHADKANDGDHRCDYCNAVLSLCDDADNNGLCDECVDFWNSKNDSNNDSNGGSQSNQNTEMDFDVNATLDTTKPITITFYHTMGQSLSHVLNRYIVEFNKLYPNITINHEQVGGYDDVRDQIKTEIAVGAQPNIAYCYPDHVALYNLAKATISLDNLIDSDLIVTHADGTTETLGLTQTQIDDFIQGYYNEGKAFGDDKMYTLPLSKSAEVLYYNKTFFDKHGLAVPTTWDELEETCKRIKEIDPNSIPLGYDSESNWFITMCEQLGSDYTSAGEDHFLFDNETNRNFVKRFRNWYQKGYVTTQEISGGYTSSLFTKGENEYGKSYMSIGSSAGATHQRPSKGNNGYPFEVGIATVPQVDAANPKVISQGPSLCIFGKSDSQEVLASWLFVKYLTTNVDFQAEFSMTSGYMPVIKSVNTDAQYADFLANADGGDQIAALSAKVGLEQEKAYYASPAFNGSSVAREQVGLLMQKCFTMQAYDDVDELIKTCFAKAVYACEVYELENVSLNGSLNDAAKLLNYMMKNNNGSGALNPYDVVAKLKVGTNTFTVTWRTDNESFKIEQSSNTGFWTIYPPLSNATNIDYSLIATIKAADGSTVELTFSQSLPVFDNTGIVAEFEEGVAYTMFMKQVNLGYNVYALNSTQNGENKYIEITMDPKAAAVFYVEVVEGGYKIYTEIDGVKNYLHAELKETGGGKVSKYIGFKADSTCVFTYDKNLSVFKIKLNGTYYGVGTYNSFETISLSDASYFKAGNINVEGGQFPIGLMTKEHADTLAPSERPTKNDPAADSTLSITDAIALGNSKSNTIYTASKYYIEGTIKEIQLDKLGSDYYGNMVITDGTSDFLVYGTWSEDGKTRYGDLADKPAVGATVKVYGIIGKYNNTAQMKDGWIVGAKPGENTGDNTDSSFNDLIGDNVVTEFTAGVAYKAFVKQINNNATYFALNTTQDGENKYIETTMDSKAAATFYFEVVTGGYKIYTEIEGVKNYLHAELKAADGGKVSKYIGFKADSDCVFTYDSALGVFKITLNGAEYGVGTYNNYKTVSLTDASYFKADNINVKDGQYPLGFVTAEFADTLG